MEEVAVICRVEELVIVLVAVMAVVPRIPPLRITCEAGVMLAAGFSLNSPAEMVVARV